MQAVRPVGVIGLDERGIDLTRRLASAGWRVLAYDPDRKLRESFPVERPAAEVAAGLTDFGAECEIVFSTLRDIAALKRAAIGDDDLPGFALALKPGSVIVHMGLGPYQDVLRFTGHLGLGGIGLIDVFTCEARGEEAKDFLVGGFHDLVERVRTPLEAIGTVTRVGATGTATGLAALGGYVRAARLIALSEALLIGRHAGLPEDLLARVFDGPIAAGPACHAITGGAPHDHGIDLEVTCRSVTDAVQFSERIGVSGECIAFARDMLSDAVRVNSGGDESALVHHLAALASPGF